MIIIKSIFANQNRSPKTMIIRIDRKTQCDCTPTRHRHRIGDDRHSTNSDTGGRRSFENRSLCYVNGVHGEGDISLLC